MKKIYSFLLMVTALLISTNMKAVDVATVDALKAAFNHYGNGETHDLKLTENITLDEDLNLYANHDVAGDIINLDLNGKTLTCGSFGIRIYKGTLNITGSGTITSSASDAIKVYGAWEDVADWSTLTVGESVNINSSVKNAITIDCQNSNVGGELFEATTKGNNQNDLSTIDYGTTFRSHVSTLPAYAADLNVDYGHSYGATVNVNGTVYGYKYGVKINGFVTGDPESINPPKVNIAAGSYVSCYQGSTIAELGAEAVAIYCSGYGNTVIEGNVTGNSAVIIKSGGVKVQGDAVITATGTYKNIEGQTSADNHGGGSVAAGSAITLITQSGRVGEITLEVSDNATITSTYGYAVYEGNQNGANTSETSGVTITGGTFVASDDALGVIAGSDALKDNNAVTVSGGNFTDESILEYVNTNSVIIAEDNNGEVKLTLTPKPEGATEPTVVGENDPTLDGNIQSTDIVKLKYGDGQTLTTDVVCAYLSISNAQTVTIPAGKTLSAGTVVLGNDAVIVVEPGGKLVVTGETGIVAFNSDNIVVEADATNNTRGILLITPEATSNTHPFATVKYTAGSYLTGSNFVFDFFGQPMYNGQVESVTASPSNRAMIVYSWNNESHDYDLLGYINQSPEIAPTAINNDFGFYAVTSNNAQSSPMTMTFKGSVNGNNDVTRTLTANNYTTFANGYLGIMDEDALYETATTAGAKGNGFYVCELQADHLQWTGYSNDDKYGQSIAPMKPIMFNNDGEAKDIVFDYGNLVWNPATGENLAPKRSNNENLTKAVIRMTGANYNDRVVVLQSDTYTEDRNMSEYANEMLSLYVSSNTNYDIYGSTDLTNTLIGYHAAQAGIYTLSFEKVQGDALTLVDLENNAQINIEEGATYTFAASANETNDARFQIVAARKMPTAVETIETVKAQKGIYNMVGKYLGENFDVLPAGIYVVNGVKVVK